MRKLVVTTFVSLDGVMQSPGNPDEDRSGGFEFGGWLVPYMDASLAAFFGRVDPSVPTVSFSDGRATRSSGRTWPHVTDSDDVLARQLQYVAQVRRVEHAHQSVVATGDCHHRRRRAVRSHVSRPTGTASFRSMEAVDSLGL